MAQPKVTCPVCGTTDVSYGKITVPLGDKKKRPTQKMTCNKKNCGHEWERDM